MAYDVPGVERIPTTSIVLPYSEMRIFAYPPPYPLT